METIDVLVGQLNRVENKIDRILPYALHAEKVPDIERKVEDLPEIRNKLGRIPRLESKVEEVLKAKWQVVGALVVINIFAQYAFRFL